MFIFSKNYRHGKIVKRTTLLLSVVLVLTLISFKYLQATPSDEPPVPNYIELLIEKEGDEFRLVSQTARYNEPSKTYRNEIREGYYLMEFLNNASEAVEFVTIPNPNIVFYDYLDADGRSLKGGKIELPKAQFAIALPQINNIRGLRIRKITEVDTVRVPPRLPAVSAQLPKRQFVIPEGLRLGPVTMIPL